MAIRLFHLTEFADSLFLSPQTQREAVHPLLLSLLASFWLVLGTNLPLWFSLMRDGGTGRPAWLGPTLLLQMVLALCALLSLLPWRRVLKPALVLLLVVAALNTHLLLRHGQYLDAAVLRRAADAGWPQVRAFVDWQLLATLLVLGVLPALLLWRLPLRRRSFCQGLWQNGLFLLVCAGLLGLWLRYGDPAALQYVRAQLALLTPFNSLLALTAGHGLLALP